MEALERVKRDQKEISRTVARKNRHSILPLTDMQRKFAVNVGVYNMTYAAALRAAGSKAKGLAAGGVEMAANPRVKAEIQRLRAETAEASKMTKKKFIDGLLEAVGIAKLQGDAGSMIFGWKEIGHACGFYEPTKAEINVSVGGKIMFDKLESLSDAELIEVIRNGRDEAQIIEGEVVREALEQEPLLLGQDLGDAPVAKNPRKTASA
jgi:hypothetical protein